jgi:hypothetical protein
VNRPLRRNGADLMTDPFRLMATMTMSAVLIALAGPAPAGGSDPKAILDDIFGQVDKMCGGNGGGPAYDLDQIAKTYFAPPLAKKIAKASEANEIDFDFLVDAQDCKTTDLDLKIIGGGDTTSIGRATFKNMGDPRIIDVEMTKAGAEWQVTNIVYRHRDFSLKDAF